MKEGSDTRHYVGKWSPDKGFQPQDLENFVVLTDTEHKTVNVYMTANYDRYLALGVDSVDETFEEFQRKLEHLRNVKIEVAPGYKLHRFLGSICPPAFRERELDALHADSLELYFEKLEAGDLWGARRVKWAMRAWMLWTVFGGAVGAVVSMLTGKEQPSK